LLRLGAATTYGARTHVVRQGEDGRHILLVLAGMLKVVADNEFGRPVLLALRGRGDLIGEISAFEGLPRTANVVTCGQTRVLLINDVHLRQFLKRNPDAWLALASSLSADLDWANSRRTEFIACPAPIRVGRVLADIAQRYGERTQAGWDLDVSLTQADIASLAGVALATFEKAVRRLQHMGLLRRRYRRIVVVDLAGLHRFAGSAP
jgi:CRP/FNR family transcriptional regulator, cyclic AMP receptor protein